jgi:hypothetical protein
VRHSFQHLMTPPPTRRMRGSSHGHHRDSKDTGRLNVLSRHIDRACSGPAPLRAPPSRGRAYWFAIANPDNPDTLTRAHAKPAEKADGHPGCRHSPRARTRACAYWSRNPCRCSQTDHFDPSAPSPFRDSQNCGSCGPSRLGLGPSQPNPSSRHQGRGAQASRVGGANLGCELSLMSRRSRPNKT